MRLSEDQKIQILLAELQERYNASHKIRERSIQFTLWISGMAIALGWLLITQKTLMLSQRISLTLLILALFAGTLYFMMGLRRGFKKNRVSMINTEHALGMYESGVYLEVVSLLPKEYRQLKGKWSDHFYTLYMWLILVAIALLILTWTTPKPMEDLVTQVKIEQLKKMEV